MRNRVLAALGGAGLAMAAASAGAGELSIGHTTWVGYGPLYLARDLGYFKELGLEVDLQVIEEASLYMAAQASGRLSGSASTIDEIMKYRSNDFCFKAVVTLDESYGGDGILVAEEVGSLADLKGKEVALNEGSVSQFWFAYLMKEAGLDYKDVTVANMTADDAAAAFIAKRIPVAVTWEPHLTLVRKRGEGKVLIDSSASPGVIVDVVALNCDVIEKQPEDIKALVIGLNKANEFIKTNREEAYEIMAKGVGGFLSDPADFAASAEGVRFYDEQMNKEYMGSLEAPGPIAELIAMGNEIWGEFGLIKMELTYADLVDPSFVDAAP